MAKGAPRGGGGSVPVVDPGACVHGMFARCAPVCILPERGPAALPPAGIALAPALTPALPPTLLGVVQAQADTFLSSKRLLPRLVRALLEVRTRCSRSVLVHARVHAHVAPPRQVVVSAITIQSALVLLLASFRRARLDLPALTCAHNQAIVANQTVDLNWKNFVPTFLISTTTVILPGLGLILLFAPVGIMRLHAHNVCARCSPCSLIPSWACSSCYEWRGRSHKVTGSNACERS